MSEGSLLRPVPVEPQTLVAVRGREFTLARARLIGYLRIQLAGRAVEEAGKTGDTGAIADALFSFLSASIGLSREDFEQANWLEIALAFKAGVEINALPGAQELAIMEFATGGSPVAWDYPARPLIVWLHFFASAYGWTKAEVEELWPEEAIALLQEIQAEEYAEHEFTHMHSEMSYERTRDGKASYRPLPKPRWMMRREKKMLIPKALLPIGEVHYPDDGQHGYELDGNDGR